MVEREVQREWLDDLAPADRRAVRSRRDLRLLNRIMGHASIIRRALHGEMRKPNGCIVEIGAGEGGLLSRVLGAGAGNEIVLVDRQQTVPAKTMEAYRERGFPVGIVVADVFDWLRRETRVYDAIVANLFLHHFEDPVLSHLLALIAQRTNLFVACEPHRAPLALAASRMLGLLGCNHVTRHDAVISVRAGFRDRDLSALWPAERAWRMSESRAGLFSHLFVARTA
jgi:2-polyprenyl-3-methyl-5-hydroxy-6-metoxy-1,4-benzoquinol methylase